MGGRGYIQWRATHLEKDRKASTIQQVRHIMMIIEWYSIISFQINNSDACFVIWDHKIWFRFWNEWILEFRFWVEFKWISQRSVDIQRLWWYVPVIPPGGIPPGTLAGGMVGSPVKVVQWYLLASASQGLGRSEIQQICNHLKREYKFEENQIVWQFCDSEYFPS